MTDRAMTAFDCTCLPLNRRLMASLLKVDEGSVHEQDCVERAVVEARASPAEPGLGHGDHPNDGYLYEGCPGCHPARDSAGLDVERLAAAMYDDGCIAPPRTDHAAHVLATLDVAREPAGAGLREAAERVVTLLLTSGREPPPLNDSGLLSTLHYYAGPNARTAVDPVEAARVTALSEAAFALRAALSEPQP